MVEKNNQPSEQEYQSLKQMLAKTPDGKVSNQPADETPSWKDIGKIVLIILGAIIAIPFLLLLTCLGIVAIGS